MNNAFSLRVLQHDDTLSDEEILIDSDSKGDALLFAEKRFGDRYQLETVDHNFYQEGEFHVIIKGGDVKINRPLPGE